MPLCHLDVPSMQLRQDSIPLQMIQKLVCKHKVARLLGQALQKERVTDIAHIRLLHISEIRHPIFSFSVQIPGEGGSVVELKENGTNIPVTKQNRSVLFFLSCYLLWVYKMSYLYSSPHIPWKYWASTLCCSSQSNNLFAFSSCSLCCMCARHQQFRDPWSSWCWHMQGYLVFSGKFLTNM